MNYALVENDTILQYGPLPPVWNDGERDWDLRPMTDPELAALGWLALVVVPRPPDTPTTTFDYTIGLVAGLPTEIWTERPKNQGELDNEAAVQNTQQMIDESDESVDKLVLVIENLNALTDMTNADINANPAAIIKDLARECKTIARQANREARLTSGRTESTDTGPVTDA